MTKEQQEIIENIKTYIHDWLSESVDEDGYERYAIDEWDKEFINAVETVLSMLKEKDAKIEHLEEKRNNQKAELAILNEKQKEMNKLTNTVSSYKGMFKKEQKDNKKKDKIIDLMAETIRKLAISLASYKGSYNKETINFTGSIKDIKQYFERKATNNG